MWFPTLRLHVHHARPWPGSDTPPRPSPLARGYQPGGGPALQHARPGPRDGPDADRRAQVGRRVAGWVDACAACRRHTPPRRTGAMPHAPSRELMNPGDGDTARPRPVCRRRSPRRVSDPKAALEPPNDQVHRRGATALDDERTSVGAASGATASSARGQCKPTGPYQISNAGRTSRFAPRALAAQRNARPRNVFRSHLPRRKLSRLRSAMPKPWFRLCSARPRKPQTARPQQQRRM